MTASWQRQRKRQREERRTDDERRGGREKHVTLEKVKEKQTKQTKVREGGL